MKLNSNGIEQARKMIRNIERMKRNPENFAFIFGEFLTGDKNNLPEYMWSLPVQINLKIADHITKVLQEEIDEATK